MSTRMSLFAKGSVPLVGCFWYGIQILQLLSMLGLHLHSLWYGCDAYVLGIVSALGKLVILKGWDRSSGFKLVAVKYCKYQFAKGLVLWEPLLGVINLNNFVIDNMFLCCLCGKQFFPHEFEFLYKHNANLSWCSDDLLLFIWSVVLSIVVVAILGLYQAEMFFDPSHSVNLDVT